MLPSLGQQNPGFLGYAASTQRNATAGSLSSLFSPGASLQCTIRGGVLCLTVWLPIVISSLSKVRGFSAHSVHSVEPMNYTCFWIYVWDRGLVVPVAFSSSSALKTMSTNSGRKGRRSSYGVTHLLEQCGRLRMGQAKPLVAEKIIETY
nr:hypothetical protein [Tanacetum cinerariifolium]